MSSPGVEVKFTCAGTVMIEMFSKVEMAADLERCAVYKPLLKRFQYSYRLYAPLLAMFVLGLCFFIVEILKRFMICSES